MGRLQLGQHFLGSVNGFLIPFDKTSAQTRHFHQHLLAFIQERFDLACQVFDQILDILQRVHSIHLSLSLLTAAHPSPCSLNRAASLTCLLFVYLFVTLFCFVTLTPD
jgi:hypothetical protein